MAAALAEAEMRALEVQKKSDSLKMATDLGP